MTSLLNSLADPNVSFANKGSLVEGGIGGTEARIADHKLKKAAEHGDLPLSFSVTNIQPAAAGSATADVSVSGPKLSSPVTQNVTFVNQGGWMLSRASAMELLQAAGTDWRAGFSPLFSYAARLVTRPCRTLARVARCGCAGPHAPPGASRPRDRWCLATSPRGEKVTVKRGVL